MRSRLDLFVLVVCLTLPACGGGGALAIPPTVQSGQTDLRTLSGTILRADGTGLAGVPGFAATLSDAEIWAALAYIKSTWPPRIRKRLDAINRRAE